MMKVRRNGISTAAWILYTLIALTFSYCVFAPLAGTFGLPKVYGVLGTVLLLLLMFGVYALIRNLRSSHARKLYEVWEITGANAFRMGRKRQLILTGVLAAVLCIAGGVIRYLVFLTGEYEPGIYMELAKVTSASLPHKIHACEDFYLRLLHAVFFLFGNHPWAGILLQGILQYLGIVACFFAVKRAAGKLPALAVTAFWTLSSYGIAQMFILGPRMLDFLLFGCAFLLLTRVVPVRGKNPLWAIAAGLFAGFAVYCDISLLVMVPLSFGILWARPARTKLPEEDEGEEGKVIAFGRMRKRHPVPAANRLLHFGVYLLSGIAAFALCILADSLLSGEGYAEVFTALTNVYGAPHADFASLREMTVLSAENVILAVLLLLGIPASVFRSDRDMGSLFVCSLTVLLALMCIGTLTDAEEGTCLAYCLLAILAGIDKALPQLTEEELSELPEEAPPAVEEEEEAEERTDDSGKESEGFEDGKKDSGEGSAEGKDGSESAESTEAAPLEIIEEETVTAVIDGEEKQVTLLKNPLTLPKKKDVHKMMDYDYEVPEDDDFDI